jgi:sigma-54 dependent transcriptional regulator of gfr operon
VKNRKREDVILAICPTGIGTSKKIVELIESSLPRKTELQIKPVEYSQIITKKLWNELSNNYNIKLLVGTINPNIEDVSFVSLENIITQRNIDIFNKIISKYLTDKEIELFNNNIIQRFSLTNILNYLTILNAEKVLDVVKSVVSKIEMKLNITLKPSVKIGLYIHLSCLVERLITKSELTTYFKINDFIAKEDKFIEIIKEAALEIENDFSVEIPVEEIGYIFDYISSNE